MTPAAAFDVTTVGPARRGGSFIWMEELEDSELLRSMGMLGWMRKGACRNGSADLALPLLDVASDSFVLPFLALPLLSSSAVLENTELSTEMIVEAEEYFFSVQLSRHEDEAERLYLDE